MRSYEILLIYKKLQKTINRATVVKYVMKLLNFKLKKSKFKYFKKTFEKQVKVFKANLETFVYLSASLKLF